MRPRRKTCILTRIVTLIATAMLAAGVLFRISPDYRMSVSIMVSVAALLLFTRSLFTGKMVSALLFFAVVGIFTPFRSNQFSGILVPVLDMATLALFAASPRMLRKSIAPVFASLPPGKV